MYISSRNMMRLFLLGRLILDGYSRRTGLHRLIGISMWLQPYLSYCLLRPLLAI